MPMGTLIGLGELGDAHGYLLLVGAMVTAIAMLAQGALLAIQDETGPVHVNIRVLEIEGLEQCVLDVSDDLLTVLAYDLKDPVEGALLKCFKAEGVQDLVAVDPVRCPGNALVLGEPVAQQGLNKGVDIPASLLVLPEYLG